MKKNTSLDNVGGGYTANQAGGPANNPSEIQANARSRNGMLQQAMTTTNNDRVPSSKSGMRRHVHRINKGSEPSPNKTIN